MNRGHIPHLKIVVAVSAFILAGFAGVSAYVLGWTDDELTKGSIIATWQNFGLLVVGFWIGSSSGGKAKDEAPTGTKDDPLAVEGASPGSKPVSTVDEPEKK